MSSININKLRFQIAELVDHFSDPEQFCNSFYEIMDNYSQRSLRPGNESITRTFLSTYNCPDQVIKQIILGLLASINFDPGIALEIADELWQDQHVESRELASKLLGHLSINFANQVKDRITLWATPTLDKAALELLFVEATRCILRENPKLLEETIASMLEKKNIEYHIIGLQALESMTKNPDYDRIPSLFKLISPFILEVDNEVVHLKLVAILSALIERTPIETAYFLKQSLAYSQENQVEKLIRRLIPQFSPDLSTNLLEALNQHQR